MAGEKRTSKSTKELYRELGKRSLSVWLPVEMTYTLKALAAEKQITLQALIVDFLNDGLKRNNKPTFED